MNSVPTVRKPLTLRLFKRVLGFSVVFVLLLAGWRAWAEYASVLDEVEVDIAAIGRSRSKGVAGALWEFNREQLALHAEGISTFRHISYAAVRDATGAVVAESGQRGSADVLDHEFPLSVSYGGQPQHVGTLHVQADLRAVREHTFEISLRRLAFNASTVFLVAGLVFWLTSSMISRHLAVMARHLQSFRLGGGSQLLTLDKKPAGDELDVLAQAVNTMQDGLAASYAQVQAAQAEVRSMARFPLENPSPVLRVGAEGQLLTANPSSVELLGLAVGQKLPEFYTTAVSRALVSGEVQHFEGDFGGLSFAFAARPVPAEGYVNIYGLDITERKAAEEALRESETRIRALFNATSDSVILMDTEGAILAINEHGARRRGLRQGEMTSRSIFDHLPPAVARSRRQHIDEVLRSQSPRTFEEERGGSFYSITVYPVLDSDGMPRQLASFSRDITEHKRAEQELKDSEARLSLAAEGGGLGMWEWRVDLDRAIVSDYWLKLKGLTREEYNQSVEQWYDGLHPQDKDQATALLAKHLKGESETFEADYRFAHPTRGWYWEHASAKVIERDALNNPVRMVGFHQDITERKQDEEALQRRVLALTQPLDSRSSIPFEDLFSLEDIQSLQDSFAESMNVASIITTPEGAPLTKPSNFCRLCSDVIRATEKGLANCYLSDAVLGKPNTTGPTIQPCLSGGLWDAGTSIIVGGRHVANWLIGQVRNEAQDESALLRYAEEIGADKEEFKAALAEVPAMSTEQFKKVAETLHVLSSELSLRAYQNVQQARFIHARQKAEANLRRNMARQQCLVRVLQHKAESVQEFLDYCLTEALTLTESRFGYIYHYSEERREFVLNSWSGEVMAACSVKGAPQVYELDKTGIWGEVVRQRQPIMVNDFQAANPLKRGYPEGHVALNNFMSVPVFHEGRIIAVAGVGNRDGDYQEGDTQQLSLLMNACWQMVARLDAEGEVRRERTFADALLDSVPGLVYLYDDQGRLVRWNKSHEVVTGYSSEELSHMHLLDWYQNDTDTSERITKAIERVNQKGFATEEALLKVKDGRRIPFYMSAVHLEIEGRSYFTGIGIDITERKQAEEEVRRSLHEKEILLKEIHHRVKNNLQIISSLLFLQAEYVLEPLDKAMFEESQKRISAMALVHEELYGSNDLSSVGMGDFVPRLVDRVVSGAVAPVRVEYAVEDVRLPVTRSIPCGLVLNELVMNAVKHAFAAQGRDGRLRVALAHKDGALELSVQDNGPGLPPDFDLEGSATLGLTLITSLAQQLSGSIKAESLAPGACFTLRFPAEEA